MIKHLLYGERYSIEGAKKRIKELRKDGELKTFKQEKVAPPQAPGLDPEKLKELRELARELKTLSQTPISKFFG